MHLEELNIFNDLFGFLTQILTSVRFVMVDVLSFVSTRKAHTNALVPMDMKSTGIKSAA